MKNELQQSVVQLPGTTALMPELFPPAVAVATDGAKMTPAPVAPASALFAQKLHAAADPLRIPQTFPTSHRQKAPAVQTRALRADSHKAAGLDHLEHSQYAVQTSVEIDRTQELSGAARVPYIVSRIGDVAEIRQLPGGEYQFHLALPESMAAANDVTITAHGENRISVNFGQSTAAEESTPGRAKSRNELLNRLRARGLAIVNVR